MSIINIDEYNCCTNAKCPFRKGCAQHETAGDFRSEDGFTPQIEVSDDGIVSCATVDKRVEYDANDKMFPSDEHLLGRGAIRISKKPIYYNLRDLWSMPAGAEVELVGDTISSGYNCKIVRHKGIEHTQLTDLIKSRKEIEKLIDFHKTELHKWRTLIKQ